MRNSAETQKMVLRRILRKNSNSEFGRKYNFNGIRSIDDFQKAVPVSSYEDYLSSVQDIRRGRKNLLTTGIVTSLAVSSGSSSSSKYIPYTEGLKEEFRKAINPWLFDLYKKNKSLLAGKAYWSITPAMPPEKKKDDKLDIGFEDEGEYFSLFQRFILKFTLAVPFGLSKISQMNSFRYASLLFLLRERDLRFISIWNPTFLSVLFSQLEEWMPELISDIRVGSISVTDGISPGLKYRLERMMPRDKRRAEELEAIFGARRNNLLPTTLCEAIWPNMEVISCWADAASAAYLGEVRRYFPHAKIQPKGLMATEAIISFPLTLENSCVLALTSHFFEFIETGAPYVAAEQEMPIRLAHQLEIGKNYSVLVTTSGGFYRYKLGDVVKVVGRRADCPLLRFVGRQDKVSDIFGEKLNEHHVEAVLKRAFNRYCLAPSFFMLAPEIEKENKTVSYTLFIELEGMGSGELSWQNLVDFNIVLEEGLAENFHYRYCRRLNQLGMARLFIIEGFRAQEVYRAFCLSSGMREGNIKPAALHTGLDWSKKFPGYFLNNGNNGV